MRVFHFLVGVALLLLERCRGPKTVCEVKHPDNGLGSLKGFTVRGYEIVIYCHRKQYQIKYDRWYIPNRVVFAYNVFAVVSNDAPEALRKACELDVELPAIIHHRNFSHILRSVQVQAYLDLLEQRMDLETKDQP